MGAGVAFFGKEQVVTAFDNRGIDTWSIFQGKDLMFAGVGKEELETHLEMLARGDARNNYRLCVYNGDVDTDCITNKTENNGSFTFRLHNEGSMNGMSIGSRSAGSSTDPVYAKLQGVIMEEVNKSIDKRLNGGDAKEETVWEKIGNAALSYVEDPQKLAGIIDVVGKYFKPGMTPAVNNMQLAGTMGNVINESVRKAGGVGGNRLSEEQEAEAKLIRLSNALERLEKCDPEILLHLEQLANLAEKNPAMYQMALSMLKNQ